MKPIQTVYKGYRFRSRLEARWAVFFDALGVPWLYEAEGFQDANGVRYLPDFFITNNNRYGPYIEIKAGKPTQSEIRKLANVCEDQTAYGLILSGPPGDHSVVSIHKEGHITTDQGAASDDFDYYFVSDSRLARPYTAAVNAARSARFEFGEVGA